MVMCDTLKRSGADAAIIRIHGKNKAIAVTVDSSANYCKSHPITGGKQIVCENWRNLVSVGAKPLAITNCLNFGNPENKDIMGEFAECLEGIKEASKYLDFPIVSGNVSFYNETKDKGIKPTPTIGGIGLIKEYKKMITMNFKKTDNHVLVVGKTDGHLDQSVFAKEIMGEKKGPPPEVNLFNEKNIGQTMLKLYTENLVESAHDVSLGGIIVAVSKMCFKGKKGIKIGKLRNLKNKFEYFFGEDQGRYIVEIKPENLKKVEEILNNNSVHFDKLGLITKNDIEIVGETKSSIDELMKYNNNWMKNYILN